MHKYKVLYVDGNDVRHLAEVELKDAMTPIGIQRYTDFDIARGFEANGTYPVLLDKSFNEIYGNLLTLCDATFTDKDQREAFKDMVKGMLSKWYDKNMSYTLKMSDQLHESK